MQKNFGFGSAPADGLTPLGAGAYAGTVLNILGCHISTGQTPPIYTNTWPARVCMSESHRCDTHPPELILTGHVSWFLWDKFWWNLCVRVLLRKWHWKYGLQNVGHCVQEPRKVTFHDDVIKWKQFLRYWTFVSVLHRSPVDSPHKAQWRGALVFSLTYAWTNNWANNRNAGGLIYYCVIMTSL